MKVEFKKLYPDSKLPLKAHESDAGYDLCAYLGDENNSPVPEHILPGCRTLVKTGFCMALSSGYEAQIRPRSGLALKHGITIANSPGTIDSGYRAEVGVILINLGPNTFIVKHGDRIAQMVIQKLPEIEVVEVEELTPATERNLGGFGSTGK